MWVYDAGMSGRIQRAAAWVILAACLAGVPGCNRGKPQVRIGSRLWLVELATDEATRNRGLGGRHEIPAGRGMLFVFPQEREVNFHMLDCHVPIDVAFINAGLRIVEVRSMGVEDDPADPKALYPSKAPVLYALELAGGELARTGVKVGDTVELLGPAATAADRAK